MSEVNKPLIPLGYESARGVITLGRHTFFTCDPDLPDDRGPIIASDDQIPQFGFVGAGFLARRVLLLGINPGNGPNTKRSASDVRMMPALSRFAREPTEQNYLAAASAYAAECQTWSVWRHCREVMAVAELAIDDIAYFNGLPWRTRSNSKFGRDVISKAANLFVAPLISEINPQIIVAMGKRAAQILMSAGVHSPGVIGWNRSQAPTAAAKCERAAAKALLASTRERLNV